MHQYLCTVQGPSDSCHTVSMTGLFGKHFYSGTLGNRIPTTCTLAGLYDSPYTKSLLCLANVNKSWEHNGEVELDKHKRIHDSLDLCHICRQSAADRQRPVFVQVNHSHTVESIH